MLSELATTALVLGLPVLLLAEELARLIPVRARAERALPARPMRQAAAVSQPMRVV